MRTYHYMENNLIYLDNCCYNRPYDDQSFLSIFLKTQAKLAIQELISKKKLKLVWSFILDYENYINPDEIVKNGVTELKILFKIIV